MVLYLEGKKKAIQEENALDVKRLKKKMVQIVLLENLNRLFIFIKYGIQRVGFDPFGIEAPDTFESENKPKPQIPSHTPS